MPRRKILKPIPNIRRKCFGCGSIKKVEHRHIQLPENWSAGNKEISREDIPGVIIHNYCSSDCGGDMFINHYTEDDFLRP